MDLPSVCSAGATITSARWNSFIVAYPQVAIDMRRPPNRLNVPSFSCAGPLRISWRLAACPTCTLVPLGNSGWKVAMPQWKPRPGASLDLAMGAPIMTASAPQATHFAMSPPVRMPPSAMTFTYLPVSSISLALAAAASASAVA